jgi:hypothetical protein
LKEQKETKVNSEKKLQELWNKLETKHTIKEKNEFIKALSSRGLFFFIPKMKLVIILCQCMNNSIGHWTSVMIIFEILLLASLIFAPPVSWCKCLCWCQIGVTTCPSVKLAANTFAGLTTWYCKTLVSCCWNSAISSWS